MLDIDPFIIATTIVSFLFMIWVLNIMTYQPLLKFMDEREKNIEEDLKKANSNDDELEKIRKEIEETIKEAKHKATKLKTEAIAQIKLQKEEKLLEKKSQLDKEYEEFLTSLEKEEENLKNSLLSQLPLYRSGLKAKLSQL